MAKTNFQYEKRQRELEKKRKAEEKARRKQEAKHRPGGEQAVDEAGYDAAETATEPDSEGESTALRQD
ncbi:hypothetical protein [Pseudoduganella flava]|nr:hypothetical protein [Pseudoduganella flava]QGZ39600.1 hypothetical protein GO485_11435 [Pseudoduganella flava]